MNQSISWGYVFITSWNIWKMDGGYCCHGYIYNTLSGCQSSLKFSDFTQVFYNSPQVTCHFNQTQYADSAQCSLWSYSLIMQAYLRSSRKDQWYSLWLDHTQSTALVASTLTITLLMWCKTLCDCLYCFYYIQGRSWIYNYPTTCAISPYHH